MKMKMDVCAYMDMDTDAEMDIDRNMGHRTSEWTQTRTDPS